MVRRAQYLGYLHSILGNGLERSLRVHTAVGIGHTATILVHTEHSRILGKEFAGQQLGHRVQLVLYIHAVLLARSEECLSLLRLYELNNLAGEHMCTYGVDAILGGQLTPIDSREVLRVDDNTLHLVVALW